MDLYSAQLGLAQFFQNALWKDLQIKIKFTDNANISVTGSDTSTIPAIEQNYLREPALASRFDVNLRKERHRNQNRSYRTNIFIDYSTVVG